MEVTPKPFKSASGNPYNPDTHFLQHQNWEEARQRRAKERSDADLELKTRIQLYEIIEGQKAKISKQEDTIHELRRQIPPKTLGGPVPVEGVEAPVKAEKPGKVRKPNPFAKPEPQAPVGGEE